MSKYPDDMDKECIRLCDAMNRFPGIMTLASCCGHGSKDFNIFFIVTGDHDKDLPILLYYFDRCHTRVPGWRVEVFTDCSADRATYTVTTSSVGEKAYREANKIVECMERYLNKEDGLI